ncbi:hypothetical protein [Pseudomonas gessardii]|uniref:Uncharacterized protein n=1 Tax=Pseudomonas gessardii TaxID=78544 RepID=A0A7Y1QMR4_9PSED|nr:hypothetical protein [Pseudomonas gessardii]NNA97395.1 hypothetical protein [Pseudomonas gessardii]
MKPWWKARRISVFVVTSALTVIAAIGISLLGIELAGGIPEWQQCLKDNASYFRLWRILFYSALAYGWYCLRRRLHRRGIDPEQHHRLLRTEVALVALLLLLELLIN